MGHEARIKYQEIIDYGYYYVEKEKQFKYKGNVDKDLYEKKEDEVSIELFNEMCQEIENKENEDIDIAPYGKIQIPNPSKEDNGTEAKSASIEYDEKSPSIDDSDTDIDNSY